MPVHTYRFVLKAEKLKLRFILKDLYEKPIDNAQCALRVENDVFVPTPDSKGKIAQDINPDAYSAFLTIKDPWTPINESLIPIQIGDMDPVHRNPGRRCG